MSVEQAPDENNPQEATWRYVLETGHGRHRLAMLPGGQRCAACAVPFQSLGGRIAQMFAGVRRSRKNPNMCNLCEEVLPPGGAEIDVGVMFADVRGSTALGERLGPTDFASLLNRFYRVANDVIVQH